MSRLLPLLLCVVTLLASCDRRFNAYYNLVVEPKPTEAVGIYRLTSGSASAKLLKQMGYHALDSTVSIKPDFTFTGRGVPACCLHGWDENAYPFTGGLYDIEGTWRVVKTQAVYALEFTFTKVVETTGRQIADPKLAKERFIPKEMNVSLIKGEEPFTIGFDVFDGDFWPIGFDRAP